MKTILEPINGEVHILKIKTEQKHTEPFKREQKGEQANSARRTNKAKMETS